MNTTTEKTIAEIVSEEFNFEVKKMPLVAMDDVEIIQTPAFGLFRNDNWKFIGSGNNCVTERYVPHTTDDVLVLVEAAQTVFPGEHSVECYWSNGHYVNVVPSKEYRKSVYGTHDNIFPTLIVRAGYDQKPFSGSLAMKRDACANLAMLRSVKESTVSIKHTAGLRKKMPELIKEFSQLATAWESMCKLVSQMQQKTVILDEYLDKVFPLKEDANAGEITRNKNVKDAVKERIKRERRTTGRSELDSSNMVVSGWEAYNGVQGYIQWEVTRKRGTSEWDRILAASKDNRVWRAEILALK